MGSGSTAQRFSKGRARRRRLGLSIAFVALGLLFPSSPASAQEIPPGILPEHGTYSPLEAQWLVNWVRYAEQALPRYADRAALPGMGYVNIGPVAPGGYEHWVNVPMFFDQHILNPDHPESLVFQRQPDGSWQLQAAMFFTHPAWTMETIPELIRFIPGWHTHPELCADDTGRIVGISRDGQCTTGRPVWIPMTHVWIVDNACGHRFGGVDGGGLHCDYEHDHGA
jgi:hypothetical protein